MPGTPALSPNFSIPRFDDADDVAFSEQLNSVTDRLDAYLADKIFQPGDLIVSAAQSRPGCLLCNGDQSLLAANYPALASVIGSGSTGVYGAAPTGYLALPDFRGRVILGAGAAAGLTARLLGQAGGAEGHNHSLTQAQALVPNHTHNLGQNGGVMLGITEVTNGGFIGLNILAVPSNDSAAAIGPSFTYLRGEALGSGATVMEGSASSVPLVGTTQPASGKVTGSLSGDTDTSGHMPPFAVANVFIKT